MEIATTGINSSALQELGEAAFLEGSSTVMGPIMLIGVGAQFLHPRKHSMITQNRTSLWALGWFLWFTGAIASYLHALE